MEIKIKDECELERAAREFLEATKGKRHIAFEGGMGVGKTTFISALCKVLGMSEEASSPTFSIINEYCSEDESERVYHFDFYRIEDDAEAIDLGLDDYFDSGDYCFMEWSGNVSRHIPDDTLFVSIEEDAEGCRILRDMNR